MTIQGTSLWSLLGAAALTLACGSSGGDNGGSGGTSGTGGGGGGNPPTVPVLGNGTHDPTSVNIQVIATEQDGLAIPRDLAFNPSVPGQLWIANRAGGPSMTIISNTGTAQQKAETRKGPGGVHFFAEPAAIAFGAPGTLASAQETDEKTQTTTPPDFMGPTLWTADLALFDAGHKSHLDMLHNSPNGVGIAYGGTGNVYWYFDGYHSAIARYDFGKDHGPGGVYHGDGILRRYAEGSFKYVENVPSHMELDAASGKLYVADTGNNRIAVLHTETGTQGKTITPNYDSGAQQNSWDGAVVQTLVEGSAFGLGQPSGLALNNGRLFVSDHATGIIHAFDLEGKHLDYLQTDSKPGGITGLEFDAQGNLYYTDLAAQKVVKISPKPAL